jgi:hypothetical protein
VSATQKARNAAFATSLQHDFSRSPHSGGINGVVINQVCSSVEWWLRYIYTLQFNAAKTINILLKPKRSRRLPAELSKWLFDFMDVSLYVPQKIMSLLRLPTSLSYLKDFSSTSRFHRLASENSVANIYFSPTA